MVEGAYPGDVAPVGHEDEHLHERCGPVFEDAVVGGLDVVVVDAESVVDVLDLRAFTGTQDGLVEVLQEDVVDLAQQQDVAVVVVHELLDAELRAGVLVAEPPGQFPLVVEQQAVLLAPGDEMQPEANTPQEAATIGEPTRLQGRQQAGVDQLGQVGGPGVPLGDPEDGLNIPHPAGRTLEIRLEVVVDVVVLTVPFALFVLLGAEEAAARPKGFAREHTVELGAQLAGAAQPATLHHRRRDDHVACRLALAVGQRAHAVADVELQVPEQAHEGGDLLLGGARILGQDQEVDVRVGVQFRPPVAAHREQREVVVVDEPVLPDLGQEGIDEAGPLGDERLDVGPRPEAFGQRLIGACDAFAQFVGVQPGVRLVAFFDGRDRDHVKSSSPRRVSTS